MSSNDIPDFPELFNACVGDKCWHDGNTQQHNGYNSIASLYLNAKLEADAHLFNTVRFKSA